MDNYEKICDIGKGSFGKVSKIKRKNDGRILVWKELNYGRMGEKEKQQLVSEVNILRELRHPNIVRYYDRIIDKESSAHAFEVAKSELVTKAIYDMNDEDMYYSLVDLDDDKYNGHDDEKVDKVLSKRTVVECDWIESFISSTGFSQLVAKV